MVAIRWTTIIVGDQRETFSRSSDLERRNRSDCRGVIVGMAEIDLLIDPSSSSLNGLKELSYLLPKGVSFKASVPDPHRLY